MSHSLAVRVAAAGAGVVVAALALSGIGTAAVLHSRAHAALDQALLAAAYAHTGRESGWEVEHVSSPLEAWLATPGDPRVPAALLRAAADAEAPLFFDRGASRLVLVAAEREDDDDDRHVVVAASGPRVTLAASTGPFAAAYAGVGALAAAGAALVQLLLVRSAFRPVDRARREADRVTDLAQGARLTETGPREVRSFLRSINAVLDRLDTAHRAQLRFSDEAAHELRTPVTVMLGELDVALRNARSAEEYRGVLVSTREEVERLRALVEGLVALARVDADAAPTRELVAASTLARAAADREADTLARAGSTLTVTVDADGPVPVQRALVEVALSNLLRNAAVHAGGTAVRLRVQRADPLWRFTVEDGGPGVPADAREAVFDRLHRGGEARRRDRAGLGLGLPLAREVARRHGGDCTIEASAEGCRVVFTLGSVA